MGKRKRLEAAYTLNRPAFLLFIPVTGIVAEVVHCCFDEIIDSFGFRNIYMEQRE